MEYNEVDMDEQEKGNVLITGASTGIGKASALLLDRSGYKVFAGVRQAQAGELLQTEGSERLSPIILDITDMRKDYQCRQDSDGSHWARSGVDRPCQQCGYRCTWATRILTP